MVGLAVVVVVVLSSRSSSSRRSRRKGEESQSAKHGSWNSVPGSQVHRPLSLRGGIVGVGT